MKKMFVVKATPLQYLAARQREFEAATKERNRWVYKAVKEMAAKGEFKTVDIILAIEDSPKDSELLHVGTFDGLLFVYDKVRGQFFSGHANRGTKNGSNRFVATVRPINSRHKDWPRLVRAILRNQKHEEQKQSA